MDFVGLVMILFGAWLIDSVVKNRPPMATLRKILENPQDVTAIMSSTAGTGETVPRVSPTTSVATGITGALTGTATAGAASGTLTGPGGGKLVPNAKGWVGYNPAFLSAVQSWAAATGKTFTVTGMGGARSLAEQVILWNKWLAGTGNRAANPYTSNGGGPHVRGVAIDVSPHPSASDIALMAQFNIGMTASGEPWHIGWLG